MKQLLQCVKGELHEREIKNESLEGSHSTNLRETQKGIQIFIRKIIHITILKQIKHMLNMISTKAIGIVQFLQYK